MKFSVESYVKAFNNKLKIYSDYRKKSLTEIDSYINKILEIKDAEDKVGLVVNLIERDSYVVTEPLAMRISVGSLRFNTDKISPLDEKSVESKFNVFKNSFKNADIIGFSSDLTAFSWVVNCNMSYSNPVNNTHFKYDFGQFTLGFSYTDGERYTITAAPKEKNKPSKVNPSIYHPHVNRAGVLCIGSYTGQIADDIDNFRFLDIIFNISAVFQEYNPVSLQEGIDISNWLGNKCGFCMKFIPEGEGVKCEKTFNYLHKKCSEKYNDKTYNPLYFKTCSVCSNSSPLWIPVDNQIICEKCNEG